ncbi:MAG: hypothetical protein GWM92_06775 [Gemmatimonadetes bacterium]|nr:hypothetical protein [Gemmatimonadota bacterium]NIR81275.1 hypothetical protein [Gemmatimonadota bacterium]NIT86910.1 hypothetical protein [Gemmatimonadota bacterium]NIU33937.1 hypothetical protein [Gemmatimonadota bacterium]NIU38116.1 hypothetical protein [Gemmatimonadota bacterium]
MTADQGIYHFAEGDSVDVAWQEAYYVWLQDRMGVELSRRLEYFKYRDRAHMRWATDRETNGWADVGTYRFHTIWPTDNHEAVHALVSAELTPAPPLVNEGIAVAHRIFPADEIFEARWNGTALDDWARTFRSEGRIPPLEELLRGPDFFRFDTEMTYPMAGSFVKSVIEAHGYGPIRAFFRASTFEDSPSAFRASFQDAFGETLDAAWARWLERLGS